MRIDELTRLEKASLLSGATVWQTRALPRAGVRSLWLADGPHGVRKQSGPADHLGLGGSEPATCFPTASALAATWNPDLLAEVGAALGAEAAALDVDVLLGPGLNVLRSPLGGRGFEYFSEDPLLSGRLAAAFVRGVQTQGVAACPKHFAVNSQELRRMTSDSVVDERTLHELYLTGFEIVVREGRPLALMSSYNKVNGTYAHESAHLLQEVLRDAWGFDGVVVSDWGGSADSVAAARHGGTLEMPAPGPDAVRRILQALDDGTLDEAALDARAGEMLRLVQRLDGRARPTVDLDAHHALARRAAAESVVLLRNEDDVLPLAPGARVAIIGDLAHTPRFQGAGSSLVNPTRVVTALEALPAAGLDVVSTARGHRRDGRADEALLAEAVAAVAGAHVVLLYLGLPESAETEGRDRADLRLPDDQVRLLEAVAAVHPRVVVVLSAGGVVEMPWLGRCAGVLHGHLGGQAGAEGMADVLTGAVEPAGRLAATYPVRLSDQAWHASFPAPGEHAEYREGPFTGYRYHASTGTPVLFPFGFGLSYTTFAYDALEVDAAGVRFTVTNTGARPGVEVAQLYVGGPAGSPLLRTARELKGFARVALAPGESRRVEIPFDRHTFRHFSVAAHDWAVEPGRWRVQVGGHVDDPRLVGDLAVAGDARGAADAATSAVPAAYAAVRLGSVPDDDFARLLGRPVPTPPPAGRPIGRDDPLARLAEARSPLGRAAHGVLAALLARAERRGRADLNLLFLQYMPFHAIATMSGGVVSLAMLDAILQIVNGRFWRGGAALGRAWAAAVRSDRRLRRALAGQGPTR